jgi:hypothetical protein
MCVEVGCVHVKINISSRNKLMEYLFPYMLRWSFDEVAYVHVEINRSSED